MLHKCKFNMLCEMLFEMLHCKFEMFDMSYKSNYKCNI